MWKHIGSRAYRTSDTAHLNDYTCARYRVLFELWFPGDTEVTLTSMLYQRCGFVTYTPRPEAADIDAKYRFLGAIDAPGDSPNPEGPIERRRARQLFQRLSRRAPISGSTHVLDFGGGDGRLIHELAARGADCHLVDYNEKAVPWVRHLGATERDLAPSEHFDLIVCSYVIEHVADPVGVLRALSGHLAAEGTIYVEVPMEIWGRARLPEEPVTHVSFFTPLSLARCLHEAGIGIDSCRLTGYLHPSGRTLLAVAAFGRAGRISPAPTSTTAAAEVQGFLRPGWRERLRRYAATPMVVSQALGYKARRALCGS